MTKKLAVAAAVKAAASGAPAFVFASTAEGSKQLQSAEKVLSHRYSHFACKACNTQTHALASTDPFCITCGSAEQEVVAAEVKPALAVASASLVSLVCAACDHQTTVQSEVASAIIAGAKKPIHCSACGAGMVLAETETFDKPTVPPTTVLKDAGSGDSVKAPPALEPKVTEVKSDLLDNELDEDVNVDLDGDGEEDDISLDDLEAANLDGVDDESDNDAQDDEDELAIDSSNTLITPDTPVITESELGGPAAELEDPLELEPFALEPEAPAYDPNGTMDLGLSPAETPAVLTISDDVGDPLLDALELDDTEMALAFVTANGRIVAMKGHVVAASLAETAETKHLFANVDVVAAAAFHAVQASGLRKGLVEAGFSLSRVPVLSKSAVEAKSKAITASADAKLKTERKVLVEALALASAGLNRGQWKGVTNPLRAAFEETLASFGVTNPKRVAASLFEQHGVGYAKTLVDVSNRLTKMTASGRAELAEMLDITSAVEDAQDDEVEVEVTAQPLEARLSTPALLRPRIAASAESAVTANDILSGRAELSFGA